VRGPAQWTPDERAESRRERQAPGRRLGRAPGEGEATPALAPWAWTALARVQRAAPRAAPAQPGGPGRAAERLGRRPAPRSAASRVDAAAPGRPVAPVVARAAAGRRPRAWAPAWGARVRRHRSPG